VLHIDFVTTQHIKGTDRSEVDTCRQSTRRPGPNMTMCRLFDRQIYRPASLRHLQRDGADILSNINTGHADILRVADAIDSRE